MEKALILTTTLFFSFCPHETELLEANRFGTKTAYQFNASVVNSSLITPSRCRPVHLNMLIRHGSRFPDDVDRKDIDELLTKLNEIYSPSFPFKYQNLTIPWNKPHEWNNAEPCELSVTGESEQYSIAKRFRSRFKQVFMKTYWNKYYKFVSRDTLRTAQSAMSFAFGIFEGEGPVSSSKFQPVAISFSGPVNNDKLLSPYDCCLRYEVDVKEHGVVEVEKFMKGPEIQNVTRKLEQKLKLSGKLSLTFDMVEKISRLCAYGIMNRGDISWCAMLDDQDIRVLEYQRDLEAYYEHSYGNQLSYKIICPLLSEMTKNLQDFSKGNSDVQGVFRFASSGSLISLLTIFGLYKDSLPLRADNFLQQSKRHFRISNMVTMSANIALVLYQCNSTEKGIKREYKVQLLVNEVPVGLPCCNGNTTCSLDRFVYCFEEVVKSCDFDAMCSLLPIGKPKTFAVIFYNLTLLAIVTPLLIVRVCDLEGLSYYSAKYLGSRLFAKIFERKTYDKKDVWTPLRSEVNQKI